MAVLGLRLRFGCSSPPAALCAAGSADGGASPRPGPERLTAPPRSRACKPHTRLTAPTPSHRPVLNAATGQSLSTPQDCERSRLATGRQRLVIENYSTRRGKELHRWLHVEARRQRLAFHADEPI
jgi:hypothetical protein